MPALSSPLPFLCKSAADAVKSGNPYVFFGGYPALDIGKPAVSAYLSLKIALYRLFSVSMFVHEA